MKKCRKYLGICWIILAFVIAYYGLVYFGLPKLYYPKGNEDIVFGIIILFILIPIIVGGMLCFGYYALIGEYDWTDSIGFLQTDSLLIEYALIIPIKQQRAIREK